MGQGAGSDGGWLRKGVEGAHLPATMINLESACSIVSSPGVSSLSLTGSMSDDKMSGSSGAVLIRWSSWPAQYVMNFQ